jgi:hypothetical protein
MTDGGQVLLDRGCRQRLGLQLDPGRHMWLSLSSARKANGVARCASARQQGTNHERPADSPSKRNAAELTSSIRARRSASSARWSAKYRQLNGQWLIAIDNPL